MEQTYTHAVVVDLNYAGYGVVRALTAYDIPVIGFIRQADKDIPEAKTRLCRRKVLFADTEELLEQLLNLPETRYEKPVLYFTTDAHVNFFMGCRQRLEEKFLVNMADDRTLDLLLDKNKFSDFALQHDIAIPKSLQITERTALDRVKEEIRFPAVFKPYLRGQAWREAGMPKAFFLRSMEEFKQAYARSMPYEQNMTLQEWVPGTDSDIHFCLSYYGDRGRRLAAFTARKIRQWPVDTGTASSAGPSDKEFVCTETDRIFRELGYQGFGAIEFKQSTLDRRFYLIEPCCRFDQTTSVATVNGVNIPLAAYTYLTGHAIPEQRPAHSPVIYIEEPAEFASTLRYFKEKRITLQEWLESLKGHRAYRYFNTKDLRVFLWIFVKKIFTLKEKCAARLQPEDQA